MKIFFQAPFFPLEAGERRPQGTRVGPARPPRGRKKER